MATLNFIVLGDWGTTRLRLFLMKGAVVLDECEGPGIGALSGPPIDALLSALAPWHERNGGTRVVLCGMAGSRNGLAEVPYVQAPAGALEWARQQLAFNAGGLDIAICPGLSRIDAFGMPDVMRGEETQIFGALRIDPTLAIGRHLVVLPGTHSKWVRLRDGVVEEFTTYMTGELFALLRTHSTLLRAGNAQEHTEGGFLTGLRRGQRCGSGIAAAAFEARSTQLIQGRTASWAAEFLSGLLIGAEVHAALTHGAEEQSVNIIGDPQLTSRYRQALAQYPLEAVELDGNRCAIAGLRMAANFTSEDS